MTRLPPADQFRACFELPDDRPREGHPDQLLAALAERLIPRVDATVSAIRVNGETVWTAGGFLAEGAYVYLSMPEGTGHLEVAVVPDFPIRPQRELSPWVGRVMWLMAGAGLAVGVSTGSVLCGLATWLGPLSAWVAADVLFGWLRDRRAAATPIDEARWREEVTRAIEQTCGGP